MRKLLVLVALLTPLSLASAAEYVINVPPSAISEVACNGNQVQRFQVNLPQGMAESTLLKASLQVKAGPAPDSQDDFVEIQVAEWGDGAPLVPAQKARPVTLGFEAGQATAVQLDLRPIIADLSTFGVLDLVLGKLSADCWGEPQLAALDAAGQCFCRLHIVTD